jgi:hypothetical protein
VPLRLRLHRVRTYSEPAQLGLSRTGIFPIFHESSRGNDLRCT